MNKVLKGFSEKQDGSMYLSPTDQIPDNIVHRKEFFETRGLGGTQLAIACLVHGAHIEMVHAQSPYLIKETDALITKAPGIILTLTGADCFPVYFEDKKAGIIGLAHCSWRGIVSGIVTKTIVALTEAGGKTDTITLTIGPGICTKHFEIQEDVLALFSNYPDCIVRDTRIQVDLKKIIKKQALAGGIIAEHISDTNECTYCLQNKYFSYRRDKPKILEAQLAYIVQFSHRKF